MHRPTVLQVSDHHHHLRKTKKIRQGKGSDGVGGANVVPEPKPLKATTTSTTRKKKNCVARCYLIICEAMVIDIGVRTGRARATISAPQRRFRKSFDAPEGTEKSICVFRGSEKQI